jgi:hypothetical protein
MSADPISTIHDLDKLVDRLDGAAKRNMQTVRNRMVPEMTGDVEAVLKTLAPTFHIVSVGPDGTKVERPGGEDAIRQTFQALCGSGTTTIWVEWDHIVIDAEKFIGVGTTRMVLTGESAAVMGYPVQDPQTKYSVSSFSTVVVDFDENGLMTRETLISDPSAATVRAAGPDEQFDNAELAAQFA